LLIELNFANWIKFNSVSELDSNILLLRNQIQGSSVSTLSKNVSHYFSLLKKTHQAADPFLWAGKGLLKCKIKHNCYFKNSEARHTLWHKIERIESTKRKLNHGSWLNIQSMFLAAFS
jgi:hypothetical protein